MHETMKKTMLFAAIAAVMALVSCNKEDQELPQEKVTKTVTFNAVVPQTKALFSTPDGSNYPVLWTENDKKVDLLLNYDYNNKLTPEIVRSGDNKTATFTAEVDAEGDAYTFVAVSPAGSVISANNTDKRFGILIPPGQTPTATSPDEKAIFLYAKSDDYDTFQNAVDLDFHHVTGYLHLVFTNYATALAGATVSSVTVTSEKVLAGRIFFFPGDGHMEENGTSGTGTVTVTTSSLDNVWVAVSPVDLSNETLTVVVNTNLGTITKRIQFGASAVLSSGKIAKFSINLDGANIVAPVQYNLVTDESQLNVGDKIIIVAANYDYAIATTQNPNNRGVAGQAKGDGVILDPSDAVEVIELEDGFKPGEYALKATKNEGYLYAASNESNYLRTDASLTRDGSWEIDIEDSAIANKENEPNPAGTTEHVAQILCNARSHGLIRFNYNDGAALFSAYTLTTAQSYVHIYRLNEPADDTPRFKATMPDADGENKVAINSDAKDDIEVYVFGNSAWTASATGGATLSKTSGTGNDILTLSVPENTSTTDAKVYTVTVSTTASVVPASYSFTVNQAKTVDTSGDPELVYSFTLSKSNSNQGSNGSYAGNCDVTIDGITWNVTGVSNSTSYDGWRLGGKSLTKVDRAMYTKTAIAADVTKVITTHNAKNITINSYTLTVHSSAADAASGSNAIATLTGTASTSEATVFQKEDSTSWAGCYFRLTYNVTNSSTSNKYVQFGGIEIWGYPAD